MVKKLSKKEVIKRLSEARRKILELIEPLDEKRWSEVFLGKWTIADFVAHLIGWDIWGKKATHEILQGKLPSYYYKYYDDDWKTINDQFVKRYKKGNKKDLLNALEKHRNRLVKELEKITEEFYNKNFGARWMKKVVTIASDTLFQADDEEIHLQQIKDWLKTGKIQ